MPAMSIINPTDEDLVKYGVARDVGVDEKVLWIGAPDMRYVVPLVTPITLSTLFLIVLYWVIKLSVLYSIAGLLIQSSEAAFMARALIAFSSLLAFLIIVDIVFLYPLKDIIYLISDNSIYVFLPKTGVARLFRNIGEPRVVARGRIIKYELSELSYIETYASFLDKNVGDVLIYPPIKDRRNPFYYNYLDPNIVVKCRKVSILFLTRIEIWKHLYAVRGAYQVSDVLKTAIQIARDARLKSS